MTCDWREKKKRKEKGKKISIVHVWYAKTPTEHGNRAIVDEIL
jgi:hypothetical protein